METRELRSERHTESDLDLGESTSAEPDPGRRPFGLSARGLQGTAFVAGFIAIVTAAVIGGAMAVDSVARVDSNQPDGNTVLDGRDLTALPPSPSPARSTAAAEKSPKDAKGEAKPKPTGDAGKKNTTDDAGKKSGADGAKSNAAVPTGGAGSSTDSSADPTTDDSNDDDGRSQGRQGQPAPLAAMGVIRNLTTGQCVDLPDSGVPAAGSAIDQYSCTPGAYDNQDFELVEQFGQVMIRNLKSNYCLDLPGPGRVAAGTLVTVGYCQAGDTENQMFEAEPQGDGYYLVNVKSGLCLDVSGADDGERNKLGQALTLAPCSPHDDHVWTVDA